jgi:hypothetical protein
VLPKEGPKKSSAAQGAGTGGPKQSKQEKE